MFVLSAGFFCIPPYLLLRVPSGGTISNSDDMQKGSRIPQNAAALILQLRFRRNLAFTGIDRIIIRNGEYPCKSIWFA